NPVILIEDGKIAAIGARENVNVPPSATRWEANGLTVVPGFVDMHIHGAAGHDVMEATPDALRAIAELVARHGTTSFAATTATATEHARWHALSGIASWMRAQKMPADRPPRAEILGVHLEGPFISRARRGVHPPEWITGPNVALSERFIAAAGGTVRLLTLAP